MGHFLSEFTRFRYLSGQYQYNFQRCHLFVGKICWVRTLMTSIMTTAVSKAQTFFVGGRLWSYWETRSRDAGPMPSYKGLLLSLYGPIIIILSHCNLYRPYFSSSSSLNDNAHPILRHCKILKCLKCKIISEQWQNNQVIRCGGGTEVLIVVRVGLRWR